MESVDLAGGHLGEVLPGSRLGRTAGRLPEWAPLGRRSGGAWRTSGGGALRPWLERKPSTKAEGPVLFNDVSPNTQNTLEALLWHTGSLQ